MTPGTIRPIPVLLILALGLGAVAEVEGQVRRGRQPAEEAPWAPVSVGVRGGWDDRANAELLGAQMRIPVVRSGIVEVVPSADIAFLPGAKEYQYSGEISWVPGGRRGGFFLTAGVGWRDSVFGADVASGERTTYFGYVLGAGLKSRVGPLEFELGLRWILLDDTSYRPTPATLGLNYPFWDPGLEGGS